MKTILISGASGFVGQYLSRRMLSAGHRVIGLGTSGGHPLEENNDFLWVSADTTIEGEWQAHAAGADVIVNLAGRSIFKPWTQAYKQAIEDSRILTTRNLVSALPDPWKGHLLTASAVGYYGDRDEVVLTESESPGQDFLAGVCRDWEAAAFKAENKGAVVSSMRFGVVLGEGGGALDVMGKAFKFFVGGPLGSGTHWFPWIHIEDLARGVEFLMDRQLGGFFNFTGTEPIRQKDFAHALGRALHRPAIMPAPAFVVKLVMGELGASLLHSQKALPQALVDNGFEFKFDRAGDALDEIYPR